MRVTGYPITGDKGSEKSLNKALQGTFNRDTTITFIFLFIRNSDSDYTLHSNTDRLLLDNNKRQEVYFRKFNPLPLAGLSLPFTVRE